jgi:hypothetical protein
MNKTIKRSQSELEILKFAGKPGGFHAYGIVSVLAARKLDGEGLVRVIEDHADAEGFGHVVVGLR